MKQTNRKRTGVWDSQFRVLFTAVEQVELSLKSFCTQGCPRRSIGIQLGISGDAQSLCSSQCECFWIYGANQRSLGTWCPALGIGFWATYYIMLEYKTQCPKLFTYCLLSGPPIPSLILGKDLIKKPVGQQKWFHKSIFCYQLCTGKTMMKE